MRALRFLLVLIILSPSLATAAEDRATIPIDNFESGKLDWRGGVTLPNKEKCLTLVKDAERGSNVLRAKLIYSGSPIFITKTLREPIPLYKCKSLSFWYKLTTKDLRTDRSFICRLRTGPRAFTDFVVAESGEIEPGKWTHAVIDMQHPKRIVNIYKSYFSAAKWITFRLEGKPGNRVEFEFFADDVEIALREPAILNYKPRIAEKDLTPVRRDVLIIRHSAASYYNFDHIVESLPFPTGQRVLKFRGLHFPIFGFPESRDALMRYALVILVDVDPYVIPMEHIQWLSDFVASGGGLLFCGGPNTFGVAKDFKAPLADLLPVAMRSGGKLVGVHREPAFGEPHCITEGIPPRLGQISRAHLLQPKKGAKVLLEIGPKKNSKVRESIPILTVGTFHKGRVAVLNTYPEVGSRLEGEFFTSDFYDDLMRQTIRWLLRAEPKVQITSFTPPPSDVMVGEKAQAAVAVKLPEGKNAHVVCFLKGGDRDCKAMALTPDRTSGTFPIATSEPGVREYVLRVRDEKGNAIAERTFRMNVHTPVEGEVRFRYGKFAAAPGTSFRFRVIGKRWAKDGYAVPERPLTAKTKLLDFANETIKKFAPKLLTAKDTSFPFAEFAFTVPDLSQGEYQVVAELMDGATVAATTRRALWIVDKLDLSRFYPIMSIVGRSAGHQEDEEAIRERVNDLLAHNFNVAAIGGRSFSEWDGLSHRAALRNYTEAFAQMQGMGLIYEYQHYTNLWSRKPPPVCVHSKAYPEALKKHVAPYLDAAAAVPRLISLKVVDEPFAGLKMMDYCDDCKRVWRERFGTEMPKKGEPIPKDNLQLRKNWIAFVRDYVTKAYRMGYNLKKQSGAEWDLLLTFCSPAYGYGRDLAKSQEDLLWWAATTDRNDFDVYPYFYPVSDKIKFLQAHFCMALMRNVSQHLKKPWGFYVELDDRNYPMQINPVEASSECAMTAVAQGADYLNSFINVTFATGCQARPERWDHLGRTLRQVRYAGPLLNVAKTPPAKVALLFPYTHWQLSAQKWAPHYAYQLLLRAFGEADIIHEEVVRRENGFKCKALVLLETDYLPDDIAELIVRFVKDGGLLLCD
ncbi:MAG: hypothetical protein GXP25_14835, partial [Planctomycetes bacterium]|nr:hypothetical protein [Planctomycetota bacterium]